MHYVIGDVHGCYDEMVALLHKIESTDPDAEIIFVGDFIDRGPKVWETLCWAMENISEDGKYRAVRGNHEQMAIDYIKKYDNWYLHEFHPENGVQYEPYSNYDIDSVMKKNLPHTGKGGKHQPSDYERVLEFFESLPFHKLIEIETLWGRKVQFRIVHAYYEHNEIPEEQQHNSNIWMRMDCGNLESEEILVHGHTPTINLDYMSWDIVNTKPGMISYRKNDINVDGGCTFTKYFPGYPDMLCAVRLEDLEEIYPFTIEERFRQISEKYDLDMDVREHTEGYLKEYVEHRFPLRDALLKKMGHPDYQSAEDIPESSILDD